MLQKDCRFCIFKLDFRFQLFQTLDFKICDKIEDKSMVIADIYVHSVQKVTLKWVRGVNCRGYIYGVINVPLLYIWWIGNTTDRRSQINLVSWISKL
jgi:hypothetical protein